MITVINNVLAQLRPFIAMVALLFAFLAAFKGLGELIPILAQIWSPKIDTQRAAILAAALALVAGRA